MREKKAVFTKRSVELLVDIQIYINVQYLESAYYMALPFKTPYVTIKWYHSIFVFCCKDCLDLLIDFHSSAIILAERTAPTRLWSHLKNITRQGLRLVEMNSLLSWWVIFLYCQIWQKRNLRARMSVDHTPPLQLVYFKFANYLCRAWQWNFLFSVEYSKTSYEITYNLIGSSGLYRIC